MDDPENLVSFERPMPIEHRVVYGLFGCGALLLATWFAQALFAHLGEGWRSENTGWGLLSILLMCGLPLIAAAIIGGHAEISLDRGARVLREVAWVGPVPAWRQTHPFADVGVPLVIQSRGGKAPAFKIEIPVKKPATVPLAYFPTREEAEAVAQRILAAVDPSGLPPFKRASEGGMRVRLASLFMQGPRGPLG
jgi:hypothetical protein